MGKCRIGIFPRLFLYTLIIFETFEFTLQERGRDRSAEWAAYIPGGHEDALDVARRHGISLSGNVLIGRQDRQLYRLSSRNIDEDQAQTISSLLQHDPRVNWVKQQSALERERKSVLPVTGRKGPHKEVVSKKWNLKDVLLSRNKRHHMDVNCVCKNVSSYPHETFGDHVYAVLDRQSDPSLSTMFNDPKWPCQWELYNCGQTSGPHRVDLNVVPCWEKGFTGRGVVVTIVDDGVDYVNEDLEHAFDERASADLNDDNDKDGPLPNKSSFGNDHGTKCGGEVSMRPNNNYCGVGIAYDATLGGIRFLDGVVTDTSEAAALVFNADYIDIYSCSWGPQDNGQTWEGPGRLASAALEVGSNEGRDGLGSIYVWAAGNGGASGDHCGADGYTCSIYTIGIASVSDQGLSTFYTESCSCIMAVTLNGGPHDMPVAIQTYKPSHYLVTTDPYHGCVNTFTGTSSAAPLASGVLALVLQANPKLSWRDVQHLIVRNSKIPNPTEDGWDINGAGFHVHHKYGFGLMDAARLVMAAQKWENVGKQQRCEVRFPNTDRFVEAGKYVTFKGHTTACSDSLNRVQELEHVQVIMTYRPKCRGDVSIELTSPCGTVSQLMSTRPLDASRGQVKEWPFMTVHSWGEDPRGVWKLRVKDNKGTVVKCNRGQYEETGVYVEEIRMIFWGTAEKKGSRRIGCHGKDKIAEEVVEENDDNNLGHASLNIDPKNPLDISERLDQEIIDAEFVGEHGKDITANDLENAKIGRKPEVKNVESNEEIEDLRARLVKFLARNDEKDTGQFLRDGIELSRSTRKFGSQ
uniref:PC3-like endoprotease variant B n=1 Tax=Styela clava TaxID=7725 RepID=UPI00193AD3AE|nr:PC3-like endoprotease variant B [Styela clava]